MDEGGFRNARRMRVRIRRRGRGIRTLPLVMLAALGGGNASAAGRRPPWRAGFVEEAPWLRLENRTNPAGIERLPTASAPARAEAPITADEPPDAVPPGVDVHHARPIHPAVHGDDRPPEERLFPRAGRTYTVRAGDTLWDVARRALGTDEIRRVARYWPRIHRANRSVIGDNPDLIFAGQKLFLPHEQRPRG